MDTPASLLFATPIKMVNGSLVGLTASSGAAPGVENDLAKPPSMSITGGNISNGRFVFPLDLRGTAPVLRVAIEGAQDVVVTGRVKLWNRVQAGQTVWYTPTHVCDLACTATAALTPAVDELLGGLRWAKTTISNAGIIAPGAEVTGGGLASAPTNVSFDGMDASFLTVDLVCPASTRAVPVLLGINLP